MEDISEISAEKPEPSESKFGVPQAIFGGLVIIAASIYISFGVPNSRAPLPQSLPADGGGKVLEGPVEVSIDDDPYLGRADAPVTIIEFSDFQCPFCRKLWRDVLPQIKKDYIDTGKVRFVYRDFPLVALHEMAQPSAEAAECAQDQGKFWDMHDKIFAQQDKKGQGTIAYTIADIKKWAGQIGLNQNQFDGCLDTGKYKSEVEKDQTDGVAAGVQGTPATFINGQLVSGAQAYEIFKRAIEEEL